MIRFKFLLFLILTYLFIYFVGIAFPGTPIEEVLAARGPIREVGVIAPVGGVVGMFLVVGAGVVSGVVPGSTSGAGGGGGGSLAAAGVTIFVSAPSPAGGGRGGDYSEEEPMDLDSLFSPATSAIASTL